MENTKSFNRAARVGLILMIIVSGLIIWGDVNPFMIVAALQFASALYVAGERIDAKPILFWTPLSMGLFMGVISIAHDTVYVPLLASGFYAGSYTNPIEIFTFDIAGYFIVMIVLMIVSDLESFGTKDNISLAPTIKTRIKLSIEIIIMYHASYILLLPLRYKAEFVNLVALISVGVFILYMVFVFLSSKKVMGWSYPFFRNFWRWLGGGSFRESTTVEYHA